MVLYCVAVITLVTGAVTGDLPLRWRNLLALPEEGRYEAHLVVRKWPVDEDRVQDAREHITRALDECLIADSDADAEYLEVRREHLLPLGPDRLWPILMRLVDEEEEHQRDDSLWFAGDAWKVRSRELSTTGQRVSSTRIRASSEVISWSLVEGARGWTVRDPLLEERDAAAGKLGELLNVYAAVEPVFRAAEAEGSVRRSETSLEFSATLRGWSTGEDLRRRSTLFYGGWGVTPGTAHVRLLETPEAYSLAFSLVDCLGATLREVDVLWSRGDPFPASMETRTFLPPGRVEIQHTQYSIIRSTEETEGDLAVAWEPRIGERVTDRRFGHAVSYKAGPDGGLPDDGWIAREAEEMAIDLGRVDPQLVPSDIPSGMEPHGVEANSGNAAVGGARTTEGSPWMRYAGTSLGALGLALVIGSWIQRRRA